LRLRKQHWHPVLESKVFSVGDLIWIDIGPHAGYNEVRALGRKELLLRKIPWWEVWLRKVRARLRKPRR
jgi:hypothetical protein